MSGFGHFSDVAGVKKVSVQTPTMPSCMIMIVDDNAPMRQVIRAVIESFSSDRDFVECVDGTEAVDAYTRLLPAWVLMDIRMPQMDGLAATKAIRSHDPGARIILVTTFDDPDFRRESAALGATAYVLKERLADLIDIMR
jgi:CheY-like chemotaxis protein